MPPRKPGTLLPLEADILIAAVLERRGGQATFHGFGLARVIQEQYGSRSLTAHGTLYKALNRLEDLGLLTSDWEDPAQAVAGRPRRRLYQLTAQGMHIADRVRADRTAGRIPRFAPETA
ncbi:PadR family transcriptional regulator [Paractinoplanes maris]|uniref:PadR family transcriptional regulator n=1 Tax=Paractinoplanes maris TaxID=1734446 RepID=UPI00201FC709|nr:helix-turn-helix transcriptional regulator [Actinoplanes maris]